MKLNVLYFAHVRERMGRSSEQLTCPDGATAAQVAEVGHSTLSAEQEAIEQIASQIVAMMELPW